MKTTKPESLGAVTHTHTHTQEPLQKGQKLATRLESYRLSQQRIREKSQSMLVRKAGITLVALVVTIVVLLILAGITIMYIMGDNGVFGKASQSKIQTELGKIEEQAGTIYYDKLMANQGTSNKVTNQEIADELGRKGNEIEIRSAGAGSVTGISLEPSTVAIGQSQTETIKVKIEGPEDGKLYYAVIDGKYYKMNFRNNALTIDREASDLKENIEEPANIEIETGYDTTIVTNAQISQTEKTIEITGGTKSGTTELTVKYGSKTATCNITVRDEIDVLWAEIDEMAKAIANDSSITNSSPQATVTVNGENKTIKVGEIYNVKYDGEIRRVRVLGFKHDDLVNTGAYGGNHSKASISFDFVDCIGTHQMNGTSLSDSTSTNGWEATEMRTYLEGENGREKLSNNSYIKQVKKKYIKTYNEASSVTTSNDYLWLLSCSEVLKDGYQSEYYGCAITKEGEQYPYYKENATEAWNAKSTKRVKYFNGSANIWWFRSTHFNGPRSFCYSYTDGIADFGTYGITYNEHGVAPGFCI